MPTTVSVLDAGSAKTRHVSFDHLKPMLVAFHSAGHGDPQRQRLRGHLVREMLPMGQNIARRYRGRGVDLEDLEQVASVGLLLAIDRFDPDRGSDFLAFAVPTVRGEVRRYFRDRSWAVRVPRPLQELVAAIEHAREELSSRLARSPRPSEIAAFLEVSVEEVLAALNASEAYSTTPLDRPLQVGDGGSKKITDRVGELDPGLQSVEDRHALEALLAELPERERTIVLMRFFGNMSQSEIAKELGYSQMHISRLLASTLSHLRTRLLADTDNPADTAP